MTGVREAQRRTELGVVLVGRRPRLRLGSGERARAGPTGRGRQRPLIRAAIARGMLHPARRTRLALPLAPPARTGRDALPAPALATAVLPCCACARRGAHGRDAQPVRASREAG